MTKLAPLASAAILALAGAAAAQDFPKDLSPEAIAAWAPGHTTLKPANVVSVGGGRLVGVTDRRPDPADPALTRITVRTEVVEASAARSAGGLSEAQDLVLDCRTRKAKAGPMRVHAQRNLGGAARTQPGWDQWTGGEPASVLGRIIDAGCKPAADSLLGAAFARPATVAPPTPVASSADLPPLAAAPAAAEPPPPVSEPPPQAELPPPPPPPEPQRPENPAASPAPPAAPEPIAAPAPASRPGMRNLFVQVAAAGSEAEAESLLSKAQADLPDLFAGRPSSVEATTVGGQTFYRALFAGFASVDEAKEVCDAAKGRGRDCLLRVK